MKTVFKIIRAIAIFIFTIIIAINIYLLGSRFLLHDNMPKIFGYSQAIVVTGSMEPVFSIGDMLIFQTQDSYDVNDIIIFAEKDYYVTHRIIDETQGGFITKGDANNIQDKEVLDPTAIVGKLAYIVPGIGNLLIFLRSPMGILMLFTIALLIIELTYIFTRSKGRRSRKR